MIIVYKYGFPAGVDTPDISSFVVKLETWLRMSGIPYDTRTGTRREMPVGKLPAARIDGLLLADSSLIIRHLQEHDPRALTDQHLTPLQRAQAEAIKALIEKHLYFISFYGRWCVDAGFDRYRPLLADYASRSAAAWQRPLLPLLLPLLLPRVRRGKMRQAWEQGTGRFAPEQVLAMGCAALQSLHVLLDGQAFLFGHQPSTVDASLFGQLHTLMKHPFPGPLQDYALAQPGLVAYHDRIWQRYWRSPDPALRASAAAAALRTD